MGKWEVVYKYHDVMTNKTEIQIQKDQVNRITVNVPNDYSTALDDDLINIAKERFFATEYAYKAQSDLIDEIANVRSEVNAVKSDSSDFQNQTLATLGTISKQILKSDITDDDYQTIISVYDEWSGDGIYYPAGKFLRHNGKAYEVIQAHTSQDDWAPISAPSLFNEIVPEKIVTEDGEEIEIIADFVQPTGAHDAYAIGDKVKFSEHIYTSKIDANVWSPEDNPNGWEFAE